MGVLLTAEDFTPMGVRHTAKRLYGGNFGIVSLFIQLKGHAKPAILLLTHRQPYFEILI